MILKIISLSLDVAPVSEIEVNPRLVKMMIKNEARMNLKLA